MHAAVSQMAQAGRHSSCTRAQRRVQVRSPASPPPCIAAPPSHLGPLALLEVLHVNQVGGHAGHVASSVLSALALDGRTRGVGGLVQGLGRKRRGVGRGG